MTVSVVTIGQLALVGLETPLDIVGLGVVTGLTYSLLGMGLVVVYKNSRVINFAQGELGALAAAPIPYLVLERGWSFWLAAMVGLSVAAGAGAVMETLVIRRLADSSRLVAMVATIGAAQVLFALNLIVIPRYRDNSAQFPVPFSARFTVGAMTFGPGHIMIVLVAPIATLALWQFFARTRVGVAARAAADNTDAARLTGIPVRRISLIMWTTTGLLAGGAAILGASIQPVTTQLSFGPNLMLRALGVAVLAQMTSLPRAFSAGVVLGIVESLTVWNYPTGGLLGIVVFVLILGSVVLQPQLARLARSGEASSWSVARASLSASAARTPRWVSQTTVSTAVAVALLVPLGASASQQVLMSGVLCFATMGLSLTVITGYAGQISLGQFAFVGLGALVGARTTALGFPIWMACLYAIASGGIVAALVGLPALRIQGLFLGVVTLGFAIAAEQWLFRQPWLTGRGSTASVLLEIPRPEWFGLDFQNERSYYYLCLSGLAATAALVHHLPHTGLGRAMTAVRDNETVAASVGIAPRRTKLTAFAISGMIASFAGFLYGGLLVSFSPATFSASFSLALIGMVIFGGIMSYPGAIVGAIWLRGGEWLLAPMFSGVARDFISVMIGGVGLLVILLMLPSGLASALVGLRDRALRQWIQPKHPDVTTQLPERARLAPHRREYLDGEISDHGQVALEARDVCVTFGGISAIQGVSIAASQGEIVGLMGPNGAGKTTLFEVMSGHRKPDAGRIFLFGRDISRVRPEQRAALGLGRTFQQARLFDEMTLQDCIKVALELSEPTETVPSLLGLPPSRAVEARKEIGSKELLSLLGLTPYGGRRMHELSTGTRRLAELGSVIALGAHVVLLDEPTAGIAQREVEAFQSVLREIRDHLDATIVLIEHNIPMVMKTVDRLYVLSAGRVLASGDPSVLRDDPAVVASYLGTDERSVNRSGSLATQLSSS